jgi:N-acetyltransferase
MRSRTRASSASSSRRTRENERARAALAALPAELEGVFRKHMLVRGGERRDSAWYSVIDDDWPAVKRNLLRRLSRGG